MKRLLDLILMLIRDAHGNLLPDYQRLTAFGKFLRSTSLDELPEIWNVIKGDMNLVGPRPLLMEYIPLYSPEQAKRHNVKPILPPVKNSPNDRESIGPKAPRSGGFRAAGNGDEIWPKETLNETTRMDRKAEVANRTGWVKKPGISIRFMQQVFDYAETILQVA